MNAQRKEWIIQKCNNAFCNDYQAWEGYDQPMTRDQMLEALAELIVHTHTQASSVDLSASTTLRGTLMKYVLI